MRAKEYKALSTYFKSLDYSEPETNHNARKFIRTLFRANLISHDAKVYYIRLVTRETRKYNPSVSSIYENDLMYIY